MNEQPSEALRLASNEIDRLRTHQDLTEVAEQRNRLVKVPNALAGLSTNDRVVLIEGALNLEAIVRSTLEVLRTDQGSK